MKSVLVSGGAGFIGSHLVEKLLGDGYNVMCLDNMFTGSKKNIAPFMTNPNFEFIRHDVVVPIIIEADEVRKGLEQIEAMFAENLRQWFNS